MDGAGHGLPLALRRRGARLFRRLFEVHESQGCYERDAEGCFLGESPAGNALAWRGLLPPTGKPRDNVELVFSPMDFLPGVWLSVEARNLGVEGVRLQARLAHYSEG